MFLYLVACPFISFSMYSTVQLINEWRITCMTKVHCTFIEPNLLVATSTASEKALIGPVHVTQEPVH